MRYVRWDDRLQAYPTSLGDPPRGLSQSPHIIHPVYDAAMPKGPLIEDRFKREAVIAIAMGCVLVGSLVAAALITGATLGF